MFHLKQTNQGFTLLELLAVFAVIGVLASMLIANVQDARLQAYEVLAQQHISTIYTAMEAGRSETGTYFFGTEDLCGTGDEHTITDANLNPFMDPVPLDPWGNPYQFDGDYQCFTGSVGCPADTDDTTRNRVVLMSCGPNGATNGSAGLPNTAGYCDYDRDNVVKILCTR